MEKNILNYVPEEISQVIEEYIGINKLTEIRLRSNKPLLVKSVKEEIVIDKYIVTKRDVNDVFDIVSEYSAYAYEECIKSGFITVRGGHRIGFCGETVIEQGKIKIIKNISFINIRIAHEVIGCGEEVSKQIVKDGQVENTLIVSPPGYGKTTLLRDVIRLLSDKYKFNISVIDERCEIGAEYNGEPQNDLGIRTDVLCNCPKEVGINTAIRTMSPQVVAVDEIGNSMDEAAIRKAMQRGVSVLATIHGKDLENINEKLKKMFNKIVLIKGPGEYKCY